jgi:hypothetical protein
MIQFDKYKFDFSAETLRKSFKDFKEELSHLWKDLSNDIREINFKNLYREATGRDTGIDTGSKKKKSEETE